MAINDIKTAGEAKVVARELERIATNGLEDDAEVFETTEMSMKGVEGLGALEKMFGDLPK